MTKREIGLRIDRTANAVTNRGIVLGVSAKRATPVLWTAQEDAVLTHEYHRITRREIATILGRTENAV